MREKIITCIIVLIILLLGVFGTLYLTGDKSETILKKENVTIKETNTISDAVDKVYNAVVYVETIVGNQATASGSGFIYKKDNKNGYIMTNYHVVEGADNVQITTMGGETIAAKVVGGDSYADLAILSIDANKVPMVAEIGDSTKLKIGDTLFTVGTPIDKEYMGTVTKGILSSQARTITINNKASSSYMMEVLQTDASINPGNSGGPLVNINGEVIGITSMKLVTDSIEGMGFAIPIEVAISSSEKLEKGEAIERPYIGVAMYDASNLATLYRHHMEVSDDIDEGVVIAEVEKNSPAEEAGLQSGDVITYVDDTKVTSSAHFKYILYKHNIGDSIKLKINRDGKETEKTLKLSKSEGNN